MGGCLRLVGRPAWNLVSSRPMRPYLRRMRTREEEEEEEGHEEEGEGWGKDKRRGEE